MKHQGRIWQAQEKPKGKGTRATLVEERGWGVALVEEAPPKGSRWKRYKEGKRGRDGGHPFAEAPMVRSHLFGESGHS